MKKWVLAALVAGLGLAAVGAIRAQSRGGRGIERMDADKDGKVSREEWVAYYTERFESTDTNGDGFVTEKEMEAARESRGGRRSRRGEDRED